MDRSGVSDASTVVIVGVYALNTDDLEGNFSRESATAPVFFFPVTVSHLRAPLRRERKTYYMLFEPDLLSHLVPRSCRRPDICSRNSSSTTTTTLLHPCHSLVLLAMDAAQHFHGPFDRG